MTCPSQSCALAPSKRFELGERQLSGQFVAKFQGIRQPLPAASDSRYDALMLRCWLFLLLSGVCTLGCGPDHSDCSGPHADFKVELQLRNRSFPADTVVHVTYGGSGMEDYSVNEQGAIHEVLFCHASNGDCSQADASSLAAAGSSGIDDTSVQAICCELWTGGYATLQVHGTDLTTTSYDLTPREHECTVSQSFVLDSPDGG